MSSPTCPQCLAEIVPTCTDCYKQYPAPPLPEIRESDVAWLRSQMAIGASINWTSLNERCTRILSVLEAVAALQGREK